MTLPSRLVLLCACAAVSTSCGSRAPALDGKLDGQTASSPDSGRAAPQRLGVVVVQTYPHAPDAFTEGLVYDGRWLYESTGQEGSSSVRRIELETGEASPLVPLESALFGEGLAKVDGTLVQLTWRSGRALIWDANTLQKLGERTYEGEGWGLCWDGAHLIVSDGTDTLRIYDRDFSLLERRPVRDRGQPVPDLNELECVGPHVYANILGSRVIARIDATTGNIDAWIDTGGLLRTTDASIETAGVLNGIAYVAERQTFLLTGKNWPLLFEVTLRAGTGSR